MPSTTMLCLYDSRFAVTASFRTVNGETGSGVAIPLTSDTGYFWFFDPTNLEEVVKVLNGCSLGGHSWVFAAGLTNVEVTTVVRDTVTGATRNYVSPQNTAWGPLQNASALPCP